MSKLEVIDFIIKIFNEELEIIIEEDISLTSNLEELGIDSIGLMTLGVYLEENFHIDISDRLYMDNPKFVGDIVNIVLESM